MAVTIYYEQDCNPDIIKDKKIAIIGYGSQGHAHALNLKDSGCDVRVGLREGSRSIEAAEEAGLRVTDMATAAEEADLIMVLVPDELQPEVYETYIAPHLKTGDTLEIGKRTLAFVQTPMVHWPDSMVTYDEYDQILFSNDAFGQHYACLLYTSDAVDD